jgi:hypothetical protein
MSSYSTPLAAVAPHGRTFHAIDVENLSGGAPLEVETIASLRGRYNSAVGVAAGAHMVVATSAASTVMNAKLGWGTCRPLFHNGKDGADNALLEVLLGENVAARFTDVVIGSGDHCFAVAARFLRNHGVRVTVVVATRQSLSNVLRKEADRVIVLDQCTPHTFGDAA